MRSTILFPLTFIYYPVNLLWNLYWKIVPSTRTSSRVISVGNITVGGTGKTSLAEYIAGRIQERGIKVAVVTRGYRRPASNSMVICDSENCGWETCGDEAAALARSLRGVKIYVDRSKTAASMKASVDGSDVIIIDDGFQHRKLARDLDIVCIDGENPFGNRLLLPSGILREPVRALNRADALVVFLRSKDNHISVPGLPAEKPVFIARKIIGHINNLEGETVDLAGKKVVGFCGIANPGSFFYTLADTGAEIAAFEKYRDHHIYKDVDTRKLQRLMEVSGAEFAVTTIKDFVKLERIWPADGNLCYIKINLAIENEARFIKLIGNG